MGSIFETSSYVNDVTAEQDHNNDKSHDGTESEEEMGHLPTENSGPQEADEEPSAHQTVTEADEEPSAHQTVTEADEERSRAGTDGHQVTAAIRTGCKALGRHARW